jgi:hypothetical protein
MKRGFSYIIVFIVGTVFGIALCMALAFYNIRKEMGKALMGPRIFGDIRIVPGKTTEQRVLSLEKDKNCFMIVIQDSNGITKSVDMVRKDNPAAGGVFTMQPLQSPGKWECFYGGSLIEGKVSGEVFWDFNFDGKFDTKYTFDGNGKKISWIFIDGDWHKVIDANKWRAKDDSAMFHFDPNTGWRKDDTNLPDKSTN